MQGAGGADVYVVNSQDERRSAAVPIPIACFACRDDHARRRDFSGPSFEKGHGPSDTDVSQHLPISFLSPRNRDPQTLGAANKGNKG